MPKKLNLPELGLYTDGTIVVLLFHIETNLSCTSPFSITCLYRHVLPYRCGSHRLNLADFKNYYCVPVIGVVVEE